MKLFFVLLLGYGSSVHAAEIGFFAALDRMLEQDQNLLAQDALNRSDLRTLDADRKSGLPSLTASLVRSVLDDWHTSRQPHTDYWQADLGLNLYRFGQDSARYRLAERGENRYAASHLRQTLDAERVASERILAFIFNSLDLSVLQKIQQVRQRLLDVSSKQYGKGLLPNQEVKKVELDLRSIDLQIKRAAVLVEQSRAEVQRYLGIDDVSVEWPIRKGTDALAALGLQKRHPAYEEAAQTLAMERERETILWAAQYPSLDAQAIANRTMDGEPLNRGSTEFLLSLTIPLLDRGLSRSLYQSQNERTSAAAHDLEWIKQNLEVQAKASGIALKESVSSIAVYEELIVTARGIYQDSLDRFERGRTTVNDLGVDEARYLNAERDRVQSWYDLQLNWLSACQSLGLRLKDCHDQAAS